jgi:membrane-associated phospholipid phosphatase
MPTNYRYASLIVVALISANETIDAQGSLGSERGDASHFVGDIWSVWTSPAGLQRRDVLTTAATIGAVGLTSRIDSSGYAWMQHHEQTFVMRLLDPVRESARYPAYELGSGQYLLPLSAALYTAGRLSHSVDLRDAGLGCAAGHLASLGIRQVAFHAVARARPKETPHPFKFSVPGSSDWSWESFYSGHISNSIACASFLGHRYSLGLAEPLPYVYSIAIGLGRLADGHHWPSDMLVGGVIGFAVGKAIADRQLHREEPVVTAGGALAHRASWSVPVAQWSVVF